MSSYGYIFPSTIYEDDGAENKEVYLELSPEGKPAVSPMHSWSSRPLPDIPVTTPPSSSPSTPRRFRLKCFSVFHVVAVVLMTCSVVGSVFATYRMFFVLPRATLGNSTVADNYTTAWEVYEPNVTEPYSLSTDFETTKSETTPPMNTTMTSEGVNVTVIPPTPPAPTPSPVEETTMTSTSTSSPNTTSTLATTKAKKPATSSTTATSRPTETTTTSSAFTETIYNFTTTLTTFACSDLQPTPRPPSPPPPPKKRTKKKQKVAK